MNHSNIHPHATQRSHTLMTLYPKTFSRALPPPKPLEVGWNAYIYQIWKERNSIIFMQKEENAEQILEHIKTSIRFRLACRFKKSSC